jgi:hypothetical protein
MENIFMSRFYTSVTNSRGKETTASGKSTGQTCHIRGWNVGVEIRARPNPANENCDIFEVWMTSGSDGQAQHSVFVANIGQGFNGQRKFEAPTRFVVQ